MNSGELVQAGGASWSGRIAGVAGFTVVVALTAAWSDTTHARAGGGLPAAIQKLEAASTGRDMQKEVLTGSGGSSTTVFELSSSFDNVHKHFAESGKLGPNGAPFAAAIDSSRGVYGTVIYVRGATVGLPNFRAFLPARLRKRPWLKFDVAEALKDPRPPLTVAVLNKLTPLIPAAKPYVFLARLGRPVKPDGTEKLGAVETTRYRQTVDFSRDKSKLPNFLQAVVSNNGGTMAVDVWVDGASVVRRVRLTSRPADVNGTTLTATYTLDFSKLGSQLTIAMPAADQVADVAAYAHRK